MSDRTLSRGQADLLILVVQLFSASSFLVTHLGTKEVPPCTFVGLRFAVAALTVVLISPQLWRHISKPLVLRGMAIGASLGAGILFMTVGLMTEASGQGAFIVSFSSLVIPVLGYFQFRNTSSRNVILGLVLASTGVALLTLNSSLEFSPGSVYLIASTFLFAEAVILTSRYAPGFHTRALVAVQLSTASALAFLLACLFEVPTLSLSKNAWLCVLYLGVCVTGIRFTLQTFAQRFTSATDVALLFTLEPVIAMFYGWLFHDETLNTREGIGCVMILLGTLFARVTERRRLKTSLSGRG